MGLSIQTSALDKRVCRRTILRYAIDSEVRAPDVMAHANEGQNGEVRHSECSHHVIVATAMRSQTATTRRMIAGTVGSQRLPNTTTAGMFPPPT